MISSGGVNSANSDDLSRIVATVAHSMGHNLGMLHDDGRTCACPQPSCLMKAVKRSVKTPAVRLQHVNSNLGRNAHPLSSAVKTVSFFQWEQFVDR
ncbi:disintegrin and metalloproteinase domain-containing protein 9-like [Stegostoma tigrinum]|uniref:disintegrin and metalloproteinase domain-containing protein 9-like n=1 Tax=Stegostoma tigrinum TaxID=3053191 RepID=UPI00287099D3|nr:disintegrin and metalloproteinase domain-containing protein 9-like [Stegostoma tigrinum]